MLWAILIGTLLTACMPVNVVTPTEPVPPTVVPTADVPEPATATLIATLTPEPTSTICAPIPTAIHVPTITPAGSAPVTPSLHRERIVFERSIPGNQSIYVMNTDGSEQTLLGTGMAPSCSPDGRHITFVSDRDGNYEVYVMDAAGSRPIKLTNNPATDAEPGWSPDGERIAFVSDREGDSQIHVMKVDGSKQTRLTSPPGDNWGSAWSPDGRTIAFSSWRHALDVVYQNSEIYLINVAEGNEVRLTDSQAAETSPTWAADGKKIAYVADIERWHTTKIFVMNADGTNATQPIKDDPWQAAHGDPEWSPKGDRIVFAVLDRLGTGLSGIYVVGVDGGHLIRLTDGLDLHPTWCAGSDE